MSRNLRCGCKACSSGPLWNHSKLIREGSFVLCHQRCSLKPSSRTRVTKSTPSPELSVFLTHRAQNRAMPFSFRTQRSRSRHVRMACALALLSFFASSITLLANTPGELRHISPGGCYCHCAQTQTRAGCPMMCDLPKYLSRWWATSCMKPRMKSGSDTKGAGPKLPHADRAEHAQNLHE